MLFAILFSIFISIKNIASQKFPKDFAFGVSTSSYQIEGAYNISKQMNIWDTFTHQPNKIYNNQNGDVTDNSYNYFLQDIEILKQLKVTHYRLSFAWNRIVVFNSKNEQIPNIDGINYYHKLINALLLNNIEPMVTMYHFDLPQQLQNLNDGWLNNDIPKFFKKYAQVCFEQFSHKVKFWITFNEPQSSCVIGYGDGIHAPGRCSDRNICQFGNSSTEPYIAAHNMLRSHAEAVELYRSSFNHGKISIVIDGDWSEPYDDNSTEAAERRLVFQFGWFADPIYFGDYPQVMRDLLKERLPTFSQSEQQKIKGSTDFFALNHYTSRYVKQRGPSEIPLDFYHDQNAEAVINNSNGDIIGPQSGCDWLLVVPWGLEKLILWLHHRYNDVIYVTENGVVTPNNETLQDTINDTFRINYLQQYLHHVYQAIQKGADVRGYFVWSLMDNFEWADGFSKRFGLFYVDFESDDKVRTPKLSANWYRNFIISQQEES